MNEYKNAVSDKAAAASPPDGRYGARCVSPLMGLVWPWPFTLKVDGACGWCGSSSSIRIPSLKFAGFAVRKIWRTMSVSINWPGDLDLWHFDLETGMRVASEVGNRPSEFRHVRPLGSWVIRYVRDGRTDKSNAYCPLPYGRGHNKGQTGVRPSS